MCACVCVHSFQLETVSSHSSLSSLFFFFVELCSLHEIFFVLPTHHSHTHSLSHTQHFLLTQHTTLSLSPHRVTSTRYQTSTQQLRPICSWHIHSVTPSPSCDSHDSHETTRRDSHPPLTSSRLTFALFRNDRGGGVVGWWLCPCSIIEKEREIEGAVLL